MKILGIETSCDETAVAVVSSEKEILANHVLSQLDAHRPYGGVVPEIAARSHIDHLDGMLETVMEELGMAFNDLDGVAVTTGPGLIGGVMVGVMMAKAIASVHGLPFMAVNHLEGHALTVRLTDDVTFPYLLLLASGGHCQLMTVEGVGRYTLLGATIDDAVGEAFDKTAKMLGLPYPGGPEVEKMAETGNRLAFEFPQPLKREKSCNFSFSGLKTAVRRSIELLKVKGGLSNQSRADICASFQYTIGEILRDRVSRAQEMYARQYPEHRTLVVAGGVAANEYLREVLRETAGVQGFRMVAPPVKLCTDNGAMIAWAGLERLQAGLTDPLSVTPKARWSLTELRDT